MKYETPSVEIVALGGNAAIATGNNGFVDQDGMDLFSNLPNA